MKVQNIALSDYAKQFKSQPYNVLKVAASITIEDMAYQLKDEEEALCVALICFKYTDRSMNSQKAFNDLFGRFDLEYDILDGVGDFYISLELIKSIFNKYKRNSFLAGLILDFLLCVKAMSQSDVDVLTLVPTKLQKSNNKSKQISKAKIICNY